MQESSTDFLRVVAFLLFVIGTLGLCVSKRRYLNILFSFEIMLMAVLLYVAHNPSCGDCLPLLVCCLALGSGVLGFAILVLYIVKKDGSQGKVQPLLKG